MPPQRHDPSESMSVLTLVPPHEDTECRPLRVVGMVRTRSGDPLAGASLDWFPVDDVVAGADGDAPRGPDLERAETPLGSTATCARGRFDIEVGDSCEHVRVVVRAENHVSLDVRLVPLPGLQPIMPPITRSGRAPLPVRRGAGSAVESWCEFALEAN